MAGAGAAGQRGGREDQASEAEGFDEHLCCLLSECDRGVFAKRRNIKVNRKEHHESRRNESGWHEGPSGGRMDETKNVYSEKLS